MDMLYIPLNGRELIRKARRESPVRQVKSSGVNVKSLFQSQKMKVTMAAESLHVEMAAMVTYDRDPEILEFYPQPVYLEIPGSSSRKNWHHTPDFLILRKSEIAIEEWRQEKRLKSLAAKYPERYQPAIGGGWESPPVAELLGNMGIRYEIRSADEHNQVYIDNLNFLRSYYRDDAPDVRPEALQAMRSLLAEHPVLPLKALINVALGKPSHGDIYEY
jgi:hypothetical protein